MTDFGTQLRDLRVRIGLTQTDLAKASSLGQSTISALETGRQGPWPSTRKALAHAFHMTLEEFNIAIVGAGFAARQPARDGAGPHSGRRGVAPYPLLFVVLDPHDPAKQIGFELGFSAVVTIAQFRKPLFIGQD